MSLEQILSKMDKSTIAEFEYAIATGKWSNGKKLSEDERTRTMCMIMLYQNKFNDTNQYMTLDQNGQIRQFPCKSSQ